VEKQTIRKQARRIVGGADAGAAARVQQEKVQFPSTMVTAAGRRRLLLFVISVKQSSARPSMRSDDSEGGGGDDADTIADREGRRNWRRD
jgi:hypothetical protein